MNAEAWRAEKSRNTSTCLKAIMVNLLSNFEKFSDPEQIQIGIRFGCTYDARRTEGHNDGRPTSIIHTHVATNCGTVVLRHAETAVSALESAESALSTRRI